MGICTDLERGQGVHHPLPPENHKFIGFPSNTGPDPLIITKLPNQHSMWASINPPAKHHSFAGRPIIACFWWFWSLAPLLNYFIRVGPPLTIIFVSAHGELIGFVRLNALHMSLHVIFGTYCFLSSKNSEFSHPWIIFRIINARIHKQWIQVLSQTNT